MKRKLFLTLFVYCPMLAWAGDTVHPVSVIGSTNQKMCISRASDDCVNVICMNSADRNCIPKCKKIGIEQCK